MHIIYVYVNLYTSGGEFFMHIASEFFMQTNVFLLENFLFWKLFIPPHANQGARLYHRGGGAALLAHAGYGPMTCNISLRSQHKELKKNF